MNTHLLELAKQKALRLSDMERIRLTSDKNSYWVFNIGGSYFIGSITTEPLPKFFPNRPQYTLSDKNGVQQGLLQQLF